MLNLKKGTDRMKIIKCTKISYDPEFVDGTQKKTAKVKISEDMYDVLEDPEDIKEYVMDEISETTGVPVLNLEYTVLV